MTTSSVPSTKPKDEDILEKHPADIPVVGSIIEEIESASPSKATAGGRTIQDIQARRQHRATTTGTSKEEKRQDIKSAAALAEEKGKPTKLKDFLKDRPIGIPMSSSGTATPAMPSSSARATPKTSPKKVTAKSVSKAVAPQVRVVGGEIVVDEDSSLLQPIEEDHLDFPMDIVNDTGRHLTSHAFVKSSGSNRWNAEDTRKFYDALSMCGTDFSLIAVLFPHKTREQIKGKFRVEERSNPKKVETFLKKKVPFDTAWMEKVQKEAEKDAPATPATDGKRGRPKQEFEGTPVSIPSIMSTPSSTKRPPLSPIKSPRSDDSPKSPSKRQKTSPTRSSPHSPTKSSPLRKSPRVKR